MKHTLLILYAAVITSATSMAQTQKPAGAPLVYGESIKLEQAEKVMAAALAEASKNNWTMAITIVDAGGNLVLFKKMDNTQLGSIEVSKSKAVTANNFKRPTKVLEDAVAGGGIGLRLLSISGVATLEGGEPIIESGKIIGAIGVSGAQATQDGQVARVGANAIN